MLLSVVENATPSAVVDYLLLVHLTDFGVAQAAYTLHGDNISKWAKTFKKAQVRLALFF